MFAAIREATKACAPNGTNGRARSAVAGEDDGDATALASEDASTTARAPSEDFRGRTYVVTGVGTSAHADACARRLVIAKARVVCATSDSAGAERARRRARGTNDSDDREDVDDGEDVGEFVVMHCDLASVESIEAFAKAFQRKAWALDGILCAENATHVEFATTEDGVERHFGVNHLGHFKLVSVLENELVRTAAANGREGRVVLVTSNLHHFTYRVRQGTTKPSRGIDFGNLNSSYGYSALASYGQSKLANILHAWKLQERWSESNAPVRCVAATVGATKEELNLSLAFPGGSMLASLVSPWVTTDVEDGVVTPLYCLTAPKLPAGVFFVDCEPVKSSLPSRDPRLAAELWDVSVEMCALEGKSSKVALP